VFATSMSTQGESDDALTALGAAPSMSVSAAHPGARGTTLGTNHRRYDLVAGSHWAPGTATHVPAPTRALDGTNPAHSLVFCNQYRPERLALGAPARALPGHARAGGSERERFDRFTLRSKSARGT
jgi:hypothetical protein